MDAILRARAKLARAEAATAVARREFFEEVAREHDAGASLAEIAKVLGVTRARVQQMIKVVRDG